MFPHFYVMKTSNICIFLQSMSENIPIHMWKKPSEFESFSFNFEDSLFIYWTIKIKNRHPSIQK